MSRDDVLRMAREAGFDVDSAFVGETPVAMIRRHGDEYLSKAIFEHSFSTRHVEVLERFAALVAADARAARIVAQTENEALKARLAASGVAERRAVYEAVRVEREACAQVCESEANEWFEQKAINACCVAANNIRARGAT